MFAPSHTLLINTGKVLARIDLAGRRKLHVRHVWTRPSKEAMSLGAFVTTALKLSPRRAGRVWVLSADVWTDVIRLPEDLSALLSGDELLQALALEAEADSGVPAFESRVAALPYRTQDQTEATDDGRWWVMQISNADIEQVSSAIRDCGARLAGVAHPAAAVLTRTASTSFDGSPEESTNPPPSIGKWCEQSLLMKLDSDANEVDAASAWQQFAEGWTNCLARRPQPPFVIAAAQQPLSQSQQILIGGGLALLTACGCGALHWRSHQKIGQVNLVITRLEAEQTTQENMLSALKKSETRLTQLRQEVAQAQIQRQKLERDLSIANATHAQQSLRWLALLNALTESTDDDCWLQQIESKPARAVLSGLATDNAAAHRFASGLERSLGTSGWIVLPAETKLGANNLVAFKIVLDAKFAPVNPEFEPIVSSLKTSHGAGQIGSMSQSVKRLTL